MLSRLCSRASSRFAVSLIFLGSLFALPVAASNAKIPDWFVPGMQFFVRAQTPGQSLEGSPDTQCTVGFPATDSNQDRLIVTAGHCGQTGDKVFAQSGQSQQEIGHILFSQEPRTDDAENLDVAVIVLNADASLPARDAQQNPVEYSGVGDAPLLSLVCLPNSQSGLSCGQVRSSLRVESIHFPSGLVRSYHVQAVSLCAAQGDSGAAIYGPRGAIGILTATKPAQSSCSDSRWLEIGKQLPARTVTSYITPLAAVMPLLGDRISGFSLLSST